MVELEQQLRYRQAVDNKVLGKKMLNKLMKRDLANLVPTALQIRKYGFGNGSYISVTGPGQQGCTH